MNYTDALNELASQNAIASLCRLCREDNPDVTRRDAYRSFVISLAGSLRKAGTAKQPNVKSGLPFTDHVLRHGLEVLRRSAEPGGSSCVWDTALARCTLGGLASGMSLASVLCGLTRERVRLEFDSIRAAHPDAPVCAEHAEAEAVA